MVVSGEQSAYTRRYCTAYSAKMPSAPIRPISAGAARNSSAPVAVPLIKMLRQEAVKYSLAASSSPWPRAMEIGTELPTPIISLMAKLMMTKGIARLSAANGVSPRMRPTRTPSAS